MKVWLLSRICEKKKILNKILELIFFKLIYTEKIYIYFFTDGLYVNP